MRIIAPMMILIIITSTLAGCTGSEDDGLEMEITITDANSIDYETTMCGREVGNDSICHIFVVSVSNYGEDDLSVDGLSRWTAVGEDGGLYEAIFVDGPVAVVGGGETSVTVGFDMSGDIGLTSLRFTPSYIDIDFIKTTIPTNYEHLIFWDIVITLEDASSSEEDGHCGYGDSEECHTLVVSVMNNGLEDFHTLFWKALGDDGILYSINSVDGIDTIVSNENSSISIDFEVPNGVKITTLYYDIPLSWIPVEQINIPSYSNG